MSIEDNFANTKRQEFMDDLTREIVKLQAQASLKVHQRPPERPLFDNGLISSPDGFHWVEPAQYHQR
jgi:hypothetical protein